MGARGRAHGVGARGRAHGGPRPLYGAGLWGGTAPGRGGGGQEGWGEFGRPLPVLHPSYGSALGFWYGAGRAKPPPCKQAQGAEIRAPGSSAGQRPLITAIKRRQTPGGARREACPPPSCPTQTGHGRGAGIYYIYIEICFNSSKAGCEAVPAPSPVPACSSVPVSPMSPVSPTSPWVPARDPTAQPG